MSDWIDYDMIIEEIKFHRQNSQDRINKYKEKLKNKQKLSDYEEASYQNEVGAELILMCLQQWCMDFKFSVEDLEELEEFKKKRHEQNTGKNNIIL